MEMTKSEEGQFGISGRINSTKFIIRFENSNVDRVHSTILLFVYIII